jgi:hypothetical protein
MPAKIEITDIYGNVLPAIQISAKPGITILPTIRLENVGDAEALGVKLSVCNIDWTFAGKQNWQGQEVVTRRFIEAIFGGKSTAIGGAFDDEDNYIMFDIPAGEYVDVGLQINIPENAVTKGMVRFVIVGSM